MFYQVKWVKYSDGEDSWELIESLAGEQKILKKFQINNLSMFEEFPNYTTKSTQLCLLHKNDILCFK